MPIKYNNFDIGNAYLGNDNLVAMYQGSNLVWTNGIKLRSLLGKQNVSFDITNTNKNNLVCCLTTNGFGDTYTQNAKTFEVIKGHKYFVSISGYFQDKVLDTIQFYSTNFATWFGDIYVVNGNGVDWLLPNKSFGGILIAEDSGTSMCINRFYTGWNNAMSDGDRIDNCVVIDLTANKLDTLNEKQVYDLITLNGTDFTNLELLGAGYEIKLGSFKNLGKYGFVDLGTIDWYGFQSGDFWCATTNYVNGKTKIYGGSEVPNIFIEGYKPNGYWYGLADKEIRIDTDGHDLYIWDNSFIGKTNNEIKQMLSGKYLIYELNNSLGNKLDNYTAEQVYYMFFATLGMSKMYVPQGVKFESSDNIITGTKYGIINLGDLDCYVWESTKGQVRFLIQGADISKYSFKRESYFSNYYIDGYKVVKSNKKNDGETYYWDNGTIQIWITSTQLIGMDNAQLKQFFNGKYMVYEMASPNGTDYNDLTAKEMYEVINDNAIDILANGKTVGGVRSIVGKQNTLSQIGTSTTGWSLWLSNNSFGVSNIEPLSASIINGHKYFCLIKFKSLQDNFKITVGTYNPILLKDENRNSLCAEQYNNYWSDMCISTINTANANGTLGCILWANNSGNFDFSLDIPESYVIIDLTENNLDGLSAQEAYQYFKENNLFKITTDGVINIGGLKK